MGKLFKFSIYKDKDEHKFIIHWTWNIPHIPFEGIEYAHTSRIHQLLFCGTDNLYWVFNKDQNNQYKFFHKTKNDNTSSGG